jgi:hypothetical protein
MNTKETIYKTSHQYTDIETGEIFSLYTGANTHDFTLISDGSEKFAPGTEINGFYLCTFSSVWIKIDGKKVIHLPLGYFYNLKEGEKITHKKFDEYERFKKA